MTEEKNKKFDYELVEAESLSDELKNQVQKTEGLVMLQKSYNPHLKVEAINIENDDFVGYIIKKGGASKEELRKAFK